MYGIHYLIVFDYISLSQGTTGPARESEDYPQRPQMEEKKTNAPITPIQPFPGDSAPLGVINTAVARGRNGSHCREGVGTDPQGRIPG